MIKNFIRLIFLLLAMFPGLFFSCTTLPRHQAVDRLTAYTVKEDETLLSRHAPVFVIENHKEKYNLIGTPGAKITKDRKERIYVNPEKATVYSEERRFKTLKGSYTNLIYRIHFEKIPAGLFPFYLGKGENIGLIVIVTLNAENQPILYTTVHTCGCYLAFVPTSCMPADGFPVNWGQGRQSVYSESLPGSLDYSDACLDRGKTMILLKNGSHRVKNIWRSSADLLKNYDVVMSEIQPLVSLEKLFLNDYETTSFYETSGPRKGYVKGSQKFRERLLMGWWAFDLRIGEDKKLGKDKTDGIVFYTSLKPWARERSDLRDFVTFSRYWKWKL